ncbi:MAG TPA: hypothetical protein VOA88_08405 [Candidatus Dormibacteraeota bacterium]|nr:hypothetical protein [Candidatus Dormibacteraeota bacterium]
MTPEMAISALKASLGLFLIWVFVFYFWKDYCLAVFRADIFTVRDELFMYAAKGNISFDDPAYKMLRHRMNVSLRYGHEFTLARFILGLTMLSNIGSPESELWEAAIADSPPSARKMLTTYRHTFAYSILKFITLRSFFLYTLVLLFQAAGGFKRVVKRYCYEKIVAGAEILESDAVEEDVRERDREDTLIEAV